MSGQRDKTLKRKFPFRLFGRRVKPRLRLVELSLLSFAVVCAALAFLGVCLVAEHLPFWLAYPLATPVVGGAWLLSTRWLIRQYVARGIMTAKQAKDYPGWPGKRGYAESWLEPPDDESAS